MPKLLYVGGDVTGAERIRALLARYDAAWQLVIVDVASLDGRLASGATRANAQADVDKAAVDAASRAGSTALRDAAAVCVHGESCAAVMATLQRLMSAQRAAPLPVVGISEPMSGEELERARGAGAGECLREDQLHLLSPVLARLLENRPRASRPLVRSRRTPPPRARRPHACRRAATRCGRRRSRRPRRRAAPGRQRRTRPERAAMS